MTDPLAAIATRTTPQTEKAAPTQVQNNAGGFTFSVSTEERLRRFLILGVEGGTFYVREHDLAIENAKIVMEWAKADPLRAVEIITEVSVSGRVPRQNPALFALAAIAGLANDDGRRAALAALPRVARTASHLFTFASYIEQFRGWGRGLRAAVGKWYTSKDVDKLAYQMVKYRNRAGFTHTDLLRLAHPEPVTSGHKALFGWATGKDRLVSIDGVEVPDERPELLKAFQELQSTKDKKRVLALIAEHSVSWEMLPDWALKEKDVWAALLDKGMPMTALMRQLNRLTNLGLLTGNRGTYTKLVCEQFADKDRLLKSRLHPLNLLVAQRTYASGQGARGSMTWAPSQHVVDALDSAFYTAFGNVEPTGKRVRLALDVSGSMTWTTIANTPLTPRDASAAMALITAATEPEHEIVAFSSGTYDLRRGGFGRRDNNRGIASAGISPRQRLTDAIDAVSNMYAGGTDCALPMLDALEQNLEFDAFVVYTDSETWAGQIHPFQALQQYRERTGINAKLVVVGMEANEFTIADPSDGGMLDVVGFDTATPALISDFIKGD